jgi:hypothetical protein
VRADITTAVLSVQLNSVLFLQFKQSKRAAALLAQSKSGPFNALQNCGYDIPS